MRPSRYVPAAALAVMLAGVSAPAASAGPAAAAAAPGRPAATARQLALAHRPTGRLQVRFKHGVSAAAQAAALDRVAARGVRVHVDRRIARLNAAVVAVGDARTAHALLRQDSTVAYVEAESRYLIAANHETTPERTEIGADVVNAAPTSDTGAGMEIALLDEPVNASNPDLAGKVTDAGFTTTDLPDQPGTTDTPCTVAACPHGTAVAAFAAGKADGNNVVGVAPGATIRSYNVFRHFTQTTSAGTYQYSSADTGDVAAALDALTQYATTHPSLVAVNMSFTAGFDSRLFRDAIDALRTAAPQVTLVAAAGNDGAERANFPAGDPQVISVGATGQVTTDSCGTPTTTTWSVASFSNRGKVDVVAPGHCVLGWYPSENPDTGAITSAPSVRKVSGTSFSSPMVAGVVALLGAAGVKGDAARAAILAGASHTSLNVSRGVGATKAVSALSLATGSAPYTMVTTDRGGQLATSVGVRKVEAIRIEPGAVNPTSAPALSATSGFGAITGVVDDTQVGYARTTATFASAPGVNRSGQTFSLVATGGAGGADTATAPMRMLDAVDSFEGVPAATGESASVALGFGIRSMYVRSARVNSGTLSWTFSYNPNSSVGGADLYFWMPSTAGGVADAADEPLGYEGRTGVGPYTDFLRVGTTDCGSVCKQGRYLVGWVLSSPADNSTAGHPSTYYKLKLTYPGPTSTLSAPPVLSSVSTTASPFTVSWGGSHVSTWDVYYGVKTKVNGVWVLSSWTPWLIGTTTTSAVFGTGGSPLPVAQDKTYHFLVRSHDAIGNTSLAVTKYTTVPFDDRNTALTYSTGWTSVAPSGRWLGTERLSGKPNAKVSLKSETARFIVVGDKCAACGAFKVYVDGVYKGTFDSHASSTVKRQALYTSGVYSGAITSHTISVVVVGTAGRPKVSIDGIATYR
jgi:hypothetical protein